MALGRLDAVTALLPNAALLLYSFVRKEAVLSSQIEGTESSLADLLLYEIDEQPGVPVDDAREVSRCVPKCLIHFKCAMVSKGSEKGPDVEIPVMDLAGFVASTLGVGDEQQG